MKMEIKFPLSVECRTIVDADKKPLVFIQRCGGGDEPHNISPVETDLLLKSLVNSINASWANWKKQKELFGIEKVPDAIDYRLFLKGE